MVQNALAGSLRRLSEGDPRVRASGHVVIVGWNRLIGEIVSELADGRPAGVIAVVVPASLRERRPEIEDELARRGTGMRVVVIAGDPGARSFERAGMTRARAVVIASGTEAPDGDSEASDLATISACLAVAKHLGATAEPIVIPLLRRGENADAIAERLPGGWRYVTADRAAAGIAGAAAAHPALARVLADGFRRGYGVGLLHPVDPDDADVGRPFGEMTRRISNGLPVGLVTESGAIEAAPPPDRKLRRGDRVLVAPRAPDGDVLRSATTEPDRVRIRLREPRPSQRRLICIAPADVVTELVKDLGARSPGRFELFVVAAADPSDLDVAAGPVAVKWHRGDPEHLTELAHAVEAITPETIVISADPGTHGASADARALLTAFRIAALDDGRSPILVDTLAGVDPSVIGDDGRIQLFPRGTVLARWIALLLADPTAAAATGALFEGRTLRLELAAVEIDGAEAAPFASVYAALLEGGVAAIGIVGADGKAEMRPSLDRPVTRGQELVLVRRRA